MYIPNTSINDKRFQKGRRCRNFIDNSCISMINIGTMCRSDSKITCISTALLIISDLNKNQTILCN